MMMLLFLLLVGHEIRVTVGQLTLLWCTNFYSALLCCAGYSGFFVVVEEFDVC